MRTRRVKTALWFLGFALALQITFIFAVTVPGIFDPQNNQFSGWYHLVLWSMLCTLVVWALLHRERRQQRLEHQPR